MDSVIQTLNNRDQNFNLSLRKFQVKTRLLADYVMQSGEETLIALIGQINSKLIDED